MPQKIPSSNQVVRYYHTIESRFGYRLLGGRKHFGYYPVGKEQIGIKEAQHLMNKELGKRLGLKKGAKVLDAGCGEGGVALYLAKHFGLTVDGIDILDFNIKTANRMVKKKKLEKYVSFTEMDYGDLSFQDETYDGVYTMETLVHAPDYKKVLEEFYRVLKKGGRLVLFEYSILPAEKLTRRQKEIADIVIQGSGMYSFPHFQHDSFPKMLKEARFKDVHVEVITPRMLPMLRQFHDIFKPPYRIIKMLGKEARFPNIVSAVEGYEHMAGDVWRYNIISAKK